TSASNLNRRPHPRRARSQIDARFNSALARVERHNWKDSGSWSSASGPRAWSLASHRSHNDVKPPKPGRNFTPEVLISRDQHPVGEHRIAVGPNDRKLLAHEY